MIKNCNNNNAPLLYCKKLTKSYKYPTVIEKVLNCITVIVQYHEIIAVIGPSGSGKSTLLHLIGGLDRPTEGDVFFEGESLYNLSDKRCSIIRNKRMGFIYQFHHLLPDFNVLENIAMPLLIGGMNFSAAYHKSKIMLELIGLQNRLNNYPHELSGGENQRVAIARSVINNPALVLADEPTGNLDRKNSDNIFQLFKTCNANYGTTFIIATHDLDLAKKCQKILVISNGILKKNTI